ncbi:transglycosylase SLT domain-containing protein [Ketogulonicigenium vulgare]|uniref:Lytic transglycosylase, catalytic n=1 Tax=Ketogulonicigenium vulgare (strain WSH-001) TaxID=759362 RepID=F9Y4G9_KETVW|nr:transglycosylase SLT domain-containing protein [Ketogulonicigenium vulgare]ADO43503.1 transglycosylase, Slt family [Ketogulonicigenium vulgare Y25]AEM41782.1 Lytic transglycosylase, catalytic [Ketogulonicigenium vulgare WSH-001]ALJ81888.1 lytic transglycosylase [Ketogulonicigenium vulgare]ANW34537.1 lytic transglycosylase [Ketogulonicigenium vulgare]AOZ55538.1 transglycosylase [Ketogulonicigenium vulgare]
MWRLVFCAALLWSGAALADQCTDAANRAAQRHGVPPPVLIAVSKAETGRHRDGRLEPWAWTINHAGRGYWLDSRADALTQARNLLAQGETNFDSGCFQINWRWHGQAFSDVSQLFDPDQSADYAARFIRRLYDELGNWSVAAGAYHSRTPALAAHYRQRFDQILTAMNDPAAGTATRALRVNTFPLLQSSGAPRGLGSLMPGRS